MNRPDWHTQQRNARRRRAWLWLAALKAITLGITVLLAGSWATVQWALGHPHWGTAAGVVVVVSACLFIPAKRRA